MRSVRAWLVIVGAALVLMAPATYANAEEGNIDAIRKAAEQGDAEAQFTLSEMYLYGKGVPQDDTKGGQWLSKAFEQGHPKAQEVMHGMIISQLRKMSEQGDMTSQFNLGSMYQVGTIVPQDTKQALYWYRKAAEQGDEQAQYLVGDIFRAAEDYVQAMHWYAFSAEQGNANAQAMLGAMYYIGKQIPANYPKAARLFNAAAKQGHPSAQANLSAMYFQGSGVPQSDLIAYAWASLAASRGADLGLKIKETVVARMTKEQISEAQKLTPTLVRISKK